MHFVHEQQRVATALLQRVFGARQRLADIFHTRKHRADGDEFGVKSIGHQPRQRGFTHTRRPPQNHRVRLFGFKRKPQWLACTQQMRLPYDIIQRAWTQLLGQRRARFALTEKIVHGATRRVTSTASPQRRRDAEVTQRTAFLCGGFSAPLRLCGEALRGITPVSHPRPWES